MSGSLESCRSKAAVCALLLLAVALVFGQTIRYDFVNYDDKFYVFENPHVSQGLSAGTVAWAFTDSHSCNWHPLTWLSHMLDCQLYGLGAGGHHLTNVLLHAAAAVLLFLVLHQMTGDLWPSAWVAAVFAVHPLRAESVAWVAERKDVLSGLCFMLTLGAYVGYVRRPFSLVRYLAVVLLFALGLMAKPMLVTLPFLMLLLDYWPLGRFHRAGDSGGNRGAALAGASRWLRSRPVVEKIPLLTLAAASCVVTCLAQTEAILAMDRIGLPSRIANAIVSYASYLVRVFYPARLAVFYPYPENGPPAWQIAGSLLLLAVLSAGVLLWIRKRPCLAVGWLWYLGMLVPVIGLVQVGAQAMADRYTYLPQIGLCLALAWGAADICREWPASRRLCGVASVVLLAALAACAWHQTSYWRNSETLWTRALACTSRNLMAHYNFGLFLQRQGKADEAMRHYREALEIRSDSVEVHYNLGLILQGRAVTDEAADHYRKALQANPAYTDAYNNLAVILHARGRTAEAIAHWQKALDLGPEYAEVHANLARAFQEQGRADEAIGHYRKALAIDPNDAALHNALGNVLLRKGATNEAIGQFRQAVEIRPGLADAHNNLGAALGRCGKIDEAMTHWQTALKIDPSQAEPHQNLGSALHQRGRTADALDQWRQAIRLSPDSAPLLNLTARVLATSPDAAIRNGAEAVGLAQRAVQLSGGRDAAFLDTLAAACAEAGRYPEAVDHAQRALALASEQGNTALADALRSRIRLYQSGSALRSQR